MAKIKGNSTSQKLKGTDAADTIDGRGGNDIIHGRGGADKLLGGSGNDTIYGDYGDSKILKGGDDKLEGNAGNDTLYGEAGNDILYGGAGADKLWGGTGADKFVFKHVEDTTVKSTSRDTIFDFSHKEKDLVDLSRIDANSALDGDQAFQFIGSAGFHNKAGELRFVKKSSDTYIYGDVNSDGKSDFAIHLDDAISFVKGDFIL
ncbi:calcium-binding protein [Mycoplana dimorpha]|uniref:Hemolysin type calcium-binding protein n=1 Tax=Mycoplana dimorpha TaxID=28320 RepID=A0A2T5AZM8_MYCDI|nr:calcium-binding protein [Mycoplana dimorpha]PTM92181.1 hemolysin type calcium-binding protein [Mycoplana dimorpha]